MHARVRTIGRRLESHAGGLALDALDGGVATVRLTGLCTGCPYKALCATGTVRPGLLDVEGVKDVHLAGYRVSAEAQERLEQRLEGTTTWHAPPAI